MTREAISNSQEHLRYSLPWCWLGLRLVVTSDILPSLGLRFPNYSEGPDR